MFYRTSGIVAIFLLMMSPSRSVEADDTEMKLRELEAQLIYEAASELVTDEEYDKAIRRSERVISEYPQTEYAGLARDRKSEVAMLRLQPKPTSGISRASLVGYGSILG